MGAIEEEITARERVDVNQGRHPPRRGVEKIPPTAIALVSGNAMGTAAPCCYCDRFHPPTRCDVVAQPEARRLLLRRNGRCFSCLRKGHLTRDCRSTNRCRTCNGRHHTSICTPPPTGRSSSYLHAPRPLPDQDPGDSRVSQTDTNNHCPSQPVTWN